MCRSGGWLVNEWVRGGRLVNEWVGLRVME